MLEKLRAVAFFSLSWSAYGCEVRERDGGKEEWNEATVLMQTVVSPLFGGWSSQGMGWENLGRISITSSNALINGYMSMWHVLCFAY